MTFVLSSRHGIRNNSESRVTHIARTFVDAVVWAAIRLVKHAGAIPAAIGRCFVMAYVDPYNTQQKRFEDNPDNY